MCTAYVSDVCRNRKGLSDSLELKLWMAVSHYVVLGAKLGPSARQQVLFRAEPSLYLAYLFMNGEI